jgi:hypothetical protein
MDTPLGFSLSSACIIQIRSKLFFQSFSFDKVVTIDLLHFIILLVYMNSSYSELELQLTRTLKLFTYYTHPSCVCVCCCSPTRIAFIMFIKLINDRSITHDSRLTYNL